MPGIDRIVGDTGSNIRESQDYRAQAAAEELAARGLNPNYFARLVYQSTAGDDPGVITLALPENFQFNFSSSFDQPFAQGIVNAPGLSQVTKFFGASLTSQSMSVQVWQGSSCPEFNLTFQLIAETDSVKDILLPVSRLSRLVVPGVVGGLLAPPGPRLDPKKVAEAGVVAAKSILGVGVQGGGIAGVLTGGFEGFVPALSATATNIGNALDGILKEPANNVTLHIGRFLKFPSVVIQNVSQTYDTVFDKRGLPLKASIDITLSTWYVPVKDDINTIFQLQG